MEKGQVPTSMKAFQINEVLNWWGSNSWCFLSFSVVYIIFISMSYPNHKSWVLLQWRKETVCTDLKVATLPYGHFQTCHIDCYSLSQIKAITWNNPYLSYLTSSRDKWDNEYEHSLNSKRELLNTDLKNYLESNNSSGKLCR